VVVDTTFLESIDIISVFSSLVKSKSEIARSREEEQVCFHSCAGIYECAGRQTHDAPEVAVIEELPLRLQEGCCVGAEEHALAAGRRNDMRRVD
jgi:hypothetical protein